MRWLTIHDDGRSIPAAVAADGSIVDLGEAARTNGESAPADMLELIRRPDDAERFHALIRSAPADARRQRTGLNFGPPISRPGKLLCLAGNYREHIVESGFAAVARTGM